MSLSTRPQWAQTQTDLTGKTVLVIGGAGGVGEGVVRAALDAGARAVAVGRRRERLDELAARIPHPQLVVDTIDALSVDLTARSAKLAERFGPFDGVIVSVASWGGQGRKPALELTDTEWNDLLASNLTAVFRLYRAFIPHLAGRGILLQLNGMSAEIPFPGAAGRALTAAAQKSLTRTIAAELGEGGPRVYEVILGMIRTRARRLAGTDDPGWIPASDVGWHVADLIAGTSPLAGNDLHYFVDVSAGPEGADSMRPLALPRPAGAAGAR
ncbi:SDR family oxidoreductase [Microbacterium sp.]|uniref:SDR family oxidoreductase n=1 Tax=Microbacterium sp. TaxID=51671 RepID=UPI003A950BF8